MTGEVRVGGEKRRDRTQMGDEHVYFCPHAHRETRPKQRRDRRSAETLRGRREMIKHARDLQPA